MSNPLPLRQIRGPIVDKNGHPTMDFLRWLAALEQKTGPALDIKGQVQSTTKIAGRTEQIGTTVGKIDSGGLVLATGLDFTRAYTNKTLDNINDGATFGRVSNTALSGNQVDLAASGVIHQAPSSKIVNNAMLNYSNNATCDSIDNGVNATIRVYGAAGGPGTTWNLTIGSLTQPSLASFSGAFNYNTDYIVYWNGSSFQVILASNALPALSDNISFTAVIHTVSAGGGGGVSGGGGTSGGGKGRLTAIQ